MAGLPTPQYDDKGNPAVERLPDDAAVVRNKLTGSDDAEFMKMMGLKDEAGEQKEEVESEVAEEQKEEEAEEVPESREDRRAEADPAQRRGQGGPPKEAVAEED